MASMRFNSDDVAAFLAEYLHRECGPITRTLGNDVYEQRLAKRQALTDAIMANYERDIAAGTLWGMLNACTEYNDHQRGKKYTRATRLASNMFGVSAASKDRALAVAVAMLK
jgi:hypothetical protein